MIIHTINHLGDRVHQMEKLLLGKDHTVATQQFLHSSYTGRLLFAHKLNIYLTSIQETQLRLYDELERVLREFLSAVRILSKGYLPASLFPPTVLHRITSNALQMVQKKNPDYVLTIKHTTEYYDMKMVTFGVSDGEKLIVAFPVFVQDHTRESMALYCYIVGLGLNCKFIDLLFKRSFIKFIKISSHFGFIVSEIIYSQTDTLT